MKFKSRYFLKDREGEEKIVRKFLWLPTLFDLEKQSRWLETADIVYQIQKVDIGHLSVIISWRWVPVRFATDDDYQNLPFERKEPHDLIEPSSMWFIVADLLVISAILVSKDHKLIVILLAIKLIQMILRLSKPGNRSEV